MHLLLPTDHCFKTVSQVGTSPNFSDTFVAINRSREDVYTTDSCTAIWPMIQAIDCSWKLVLMAKVVEMLNKVASQMTEV